MLRISLVFNFMTPGVLKIYIIHEICLDLLVRLSSINIEKYNFNFLFICQFLFIIFKVPLHYPLFYLQDLQFLL